MEGYVWASRSIASNQISFRGVPRNDIDCHRTSSTYKTYVGCIITP